MLKIIKWLIKTYVKRHPEYLATGGICVDEITEVDIIVCVEGDRVAQNKTRSNRRMEQESRQWLTT